MLRSAGMARSRWSWWRSRRLACGMSIPMFFPGWPCTTRLSQSIVYTCESFAMANRRLQQTTTSTNRKPTWADWRGCSMIQREHVRFKVAWMALALIGVATFGFGLIVTLWPGASEPLVFRAIGVASMGMGFFGGMITLIPYRRRERWAWFTLWYYPLFWLAHFLDGLPP